ncbi:MAG: hypothetical protein IIY55_10710 [Blautia sp.]|nr:hypothetical protein [Blautia sp.]
MKEQYVTPKVEVLEFDYDDVVLTSIAPNGNCRTGGSYSEYGNDCRSSYQMWMADVVS